jgi:predicted transcriptional regulator of viral defense system
MAQSKQYRAVYEVAEGQQGYFTAAQVAAAGVPGAHLPDMLRRGVVERVSRGVYRLIAYPRAATGQYMEASLWPGGHSRDVQGVISHESALAIHELSDASPSKIHITVPRELRIRRTVPRYLFVHHADLDSAEIEWRDGMPVTTPVRTIRDCHAAHLGPALVRQAIEDARRRGLIPAREADALEAELLGAALAPSTRASLR